MEEDGFLLARERVLPVNKLSPLSPDQQFSTALLPVLSGKARCMLKSKPKKQAVLSVGLPWVFVCRRTLPRRGSLSFRFSEGKGPGLSLEVPGSSDPCCIPQGLMGCCQRM